MTEENRKLRKWQDVLARDELLYSEELAKMEEREAAYKGSRTLTSGVSGDKKKKASHVRNLTAELIEAQVSSSIPQPKVRAQRQRDEWKAKLIEDMLRNEIDRLPMEQINDVIERTVPIQGGALYLVEWDSEKRTHTTVGEVAVTPVHPRQVIPQGGVYSGIDKMDHIILKIPQTVQGIYRAYKVDVRKDGEEDDTVTQYTVYYKNGSGGIGKYSWAQDTELEDMEDYQARRLWRCPDCGEILPNKREDEPCPLCGSKGGKERESGQKEEILALPTLCSDGRVLPPMKVPAYKPGIYPLILQKNVSVFGRFLGDSDVDKIADQQNTVNRIETKIIDKLLKSGSYLVMPDNADIRVDSEEMKVIRPGDPAAASMIGVKDLEGNISQDLSYLAQVYEEARQVTGITDSYQGRRDETAISGRAKEFAANQSAGRLESKRVMKNAAYALLFEAMFKFKLAYADEKRPVISTAPDGSPVYGEFNRYDFLEQDEAGEWYWNDQFLFSCDTTEPLAGNREAMWQETRENLQTGAFGDPALKETLILFWTKMEMLHYPGAGETKKYLEQMAQREKLSQGTGLSY